MEILDPQRFSRGMAIGPMPARAGDGAAGPSSGLTSSGIGPLA
jgi:hypothetical protein